MNKVRLAWLGILLGCCSLVACAVLVPERWAAVWSWMDQLFALTAAAVVLTVAPDLWPALCRHVREALLRAQRLDGQAWFWLRLCVPLTATYWCRDQGLPIWWVWLSARPVIWLACCLLPRRLNAARAGEWLAGDGSAGLPSGRDNNLNLMRLVLAACVVLSHSWEMSGHREPILSPLQQRFSLGGMAVDWFFIISGFLLVVSVDRLSPWRYLLNRLVRLMPAYLVLQTAAFLIWHPALTWDSALAVLQFHGFPILPFDPNPFAGYCGTCWTLPFEATCYLLLLVLSITGAARTRLGALVLVAACEWYWIVSGQYLDYRLPFRFFVFFAAGMLWCRLGIAPSGRLAAIALAVLAASIAASHVLAFHLTLALLPFALPPIIFWLAFTARRAAWTENDFSYGLYLWGWPITDALIWVSGRSMPPLLVFLLALPTSLLVARISWFCIERPALQAVRRRRREAAQPVPPVPADEQQPVAA